MAEKKTKRKLHQEFSELYAKLQRTKREQCITAAHPREWLKLRTWHSWVSLPREM